MYHADMVVEMAHENVAGTLQAEEMEHESSCKLAVAMAPVHTADNPAEGMQLSNSSDKNLASATAPSEEEHDTPAVVEQGFVRGVRHTSFSIQDDRSSACSV